MPMILISAGHHEGAQGAQWNGHTEWREACRWRDYIAHRLGPDKSIVVPSGLLGDKVLYVNRARATAAVEIHFNSAIVNGQHVGDGCETLYHPGSVEGKNLAGHLQDAMVRIEGLRPDRNIKEGWYRQDAPGRVDYHGDHDGDEKPLYFLKATKCPAVIIEPQFMHHYDSIQYHRIAACEVLVEALLQYLNDRRIS